MITSTMKDNCGVCQRFSYVYGNARRDIYQNLDATFGLNNVCLKRHVKGLCLSFSWYFFCDPFVLSVSLKGLMERVRHALMLGFSGGCQSIFYNQGQGSWRSLSKREPWIDKPLKSPAFLSIDMLSWLTSSKVIVFFFFFFFFFVK